MLSSITSFFSNSFSNLFSPTPPPAVEPPSLFATYAPFVALAALTAAFVWSAKEVIQIRNHFKKNAPERLKLESEFNQSISKHQKLIDTLEASATLRAQNATARGKALAKELTRIKSAGEAEQQKLEAAVELGDKNLKTKHRELKQSTRDYRATARELREIDEKLQEALQS